MKLQSLLIQFRILTVRQDLFKEIREGAKIKGERHVEAERVSKGSPQMTIWLPDNPKRLVGFQKKDQISSANEREL